MNSIQWIHRCFPYIPDFPTFSSVVPGPGLSPRPERRAAARRGEPRDAAGGAGAGGLPGGRGRRQGARGDVGRCFRRWLYTDMTDMIDICTVIIY